MTGLRFVVSEPPKISAAMWTSVVQPACGEQAGVVRLRRASSVNAQLVGKTHRDQRPMQAVLERKAHAEVRRQAERRDQLRRADPFAVRRFGVHASRLFPRCCGRRMASDVGRTPDCPSFRAFLASVHRPATSRPAG